MTEVIDHTERKAKKQYKCDYCGETIEKGETYDYYKGKYDGSLYVWRSHLACQRVADAIWDYADPDEGMDADLFDTTCQEICQAFVCPHCPKWDKKYECCEDDEVYCIDRMDDFFKTRELYQPERKRGYYYWKCRERDSSEQGGIQGSDG